MASVKSVMEMSDLLPQGMQEAYMSQVSSDMVLQQVWPVHTALSVLVVFLGCFINSLFPHPPSSSPLPPCSISLLSSFSQFL
jgi:uncharacterized membrane protein